MGNPNNSYTHGFEYAEEIQAMRKQRQVELVVCLTYFLLQQEIRARTLVAQT